MENKDSFFNFKYIQGGVLNSQDTNKFLTEDPCLEIRVVLLWCNWDMVWSQQRLRLLDRFKKLLNDWEDYEKIILEFENKCNIMDEDFELFTKFMNEDLRSSPLSLFQLQEGLAALNEDYSDALNKCFGLRHTFGEIEKKTRFLIAEVERVGLFETIVLHRHYYRGILFASR